VLRANSSSFVAPHLIDVLNAFGLFARGAERRAIGLANPILPVLGTSGAVTEGENRRRATFVHEHQDRVTRESPKPVAANGPTLPGLPDNCARPRLIECQPQSLLELVEKGMTEAFALLLVPT